MMYWMRVVGMVGRGGVIHGQEDAGGALEQEQEQAGRAECVPPVALWFGAVEQIFLQVVQAEAFIQPGKSFFHMSALPQKDVEDAFPVDVEFRKTVERTRRRAVQHAPVLPETGVVARAGSTPDPPLQLTVQERCVQRLFRIRRSSGFSDLRMTNPPWLVAVRSQPFTLVMVNENG